MHRFGVMASAIFLSGACGAPASPRPDPPKDSGSHVVQAAPSKPPESDGRIARTELITILDAGLGRFLQGVEIEPVLENGQFVGFRIVSLWPKDERFRGIDLRDGDVVIRINGQPIERPEQALQIWEGLRVASELVIQYRRAGERFETRFEIVD